MLPCLSESSIQLGTSKILYQKSFSYPSKSYCIKILPFKAIPARISLDFDLLFFLHHWRFHTVNTKGFTGPNSVAFFYQLISIPTGRKILHSNSSQHPHITIVTLHGSLRQEGSCPSLNSLSSQLASFTCGHRLKLLEKLAIFFFLRQNCSV